MKTFTRACCFGVEPVDFVKLTRFSRTVVEPLDGFAMKKSPKKPRWDGRCVEYLATDAREGGQHHRRSDQSEESGQVAIAAIG